MSDRFPLTRHKGGQWFRKFRGRFYYFGTDKDKALARMVKEWPEITAGRPPARDAGPAGLTLEDLVNQFLTRKSKQVEAGDLGAEVLAHYRRVCGQAIAALGWSRPVATLTPADFGDLRDRLAPGLSPATLAYRVKLARALFNYGGELLDKRVRYGDQFGLPPKRVMRLHRETRAPKLLTADQLRAMLAAADPVTRAMILLGVNCAFGSADLSDLRASHVRDGWVALPRRKTGSARRCPLWPETVEALEAAARARPRPADPADSTRLFLSPTGRPVKRFASRRDGRSGERGDAARQAFLRVAKAAGVRLPKGSNFYVLKHVFRTVADEIPDRSAINAITGHDDGTIASAHYVERVDDRRLEAVVDHVRRWLWPCAKK